MNLKKRNELIAIIKITAAVLATAFALAFLIGTSCGVPGEPNTADGWFRKGKAYADDEVYGKAIECFSKAMSLDPEFAEAYSYRGFCYFWMVQYEKALADFEMALKIGVDHPEEIHFYIGRTYFKMGNYEEAVTSFTNAIEINKEIAEYYYKRGASY
ncbi:MAG: tetratricopeptide repeat protein, partial [Deltaproteobacteria bacterium]|nr:tetratricopeptide repeat protein [Candidatus Zymogenus saltonus]